MAKTEVYFFSGTGNSLVIARSLSEKLGGKLVPIASLVHQDLINTDAETIGLVFPIYDFKAPPMIESFVEKFSTLDGKYVFAVATYGFMPMNAMKKLSKTVKSCGGKLSGGFVVSMPNNGIITETMTAKRENKMRKDCSAKLEKINDYVAAKKEGKLETTNILTNLFLNGLFIKATPKLLGLGKEVALHGWKSFAFVADSKCTGCGVCVQVCPFNNITLADGKPSWGTECITCFACLQWCPKAAIQAGRITVKQKRYHHPDVKVSDVINQKSPIATT